MIPRRLTLFWLCAGLLLPVPPALAQKSNAEALIHEADEAFNQRNDSGKNSGTQTDIAIDRLEFALAADPQSLTARLRLAYLYLDSLPTEFLHKNERTDFVLKTYRDALAADSGNPVLLWDMAVAEFQAKNCPEARDWMKKYLDVEPESSKGNTALAQISQCLVDQPLHDARAALRTSSGSDPVASAALRQTLGRKYLPTLNEGIAAARKSLSIKSEEVQALSALRALLYLKATLLDTSSAISLSSEVSSLDTRIEEARVAQKAAIETSKGPLVEPAKFTPGEPPPPADELLVEMLPPPPPPPPPSREPKRAAPPYKDLSSSDVVVETRNVPAAVHPNRVLVLWMSEPSKHDRGPLSPEKPYTCQEHSLGSYYQGRLYLSLADTQTKTFLNTIELQDPAKYGTDEYDSRLPYRIAPDPYRVSGELKDGEGKPEFLHLEDYNGDGQSLEVALFNAKDCAETQATILGYSAKRDRAVRYRFILEKNESMGGGYLNLFWIGNLIPQKPDEPQHWKYEIDRRASDGFIEVIELRYDPAEEIFRGKVSRK